LIGSRIKKSDHIPDAHEGRSDRLGKKVVAARDTDNVSCAVRGHKCYDITLDCVGGAMTSLCCDVVDFEGSVANDVGLTTSGELANGGLAHGFLRRRSRPRRGTGALPDLLVDLGFANEELIVRKLLLLPPSRKFQSPYEIPLDPLSETCAFEREISELARKDLQNLDVTSLAQALSVSQRTLARRFLDELQTSPGRWIQERRLAAARALLEGTKLSVSEVCHRIGYEDVASFSRLFSKATGMAPGEFRRQARS
jgi:AraC-like DNA-binding protein